MKNLTKKLFLSMLTVAFAVVALGTTTFAWFTLATEARVEPFEAQVTGGAGFEIAATKVTEKPADGSWFSGSLPASEIQKTLPENFRFNALTPVSNAFQQFNSYELEGGSYGETLANDGYIEFDLHFRLVDQNSNVTYGLNLMNIGLTGSDEPWECDKEYYINKDTKSIVTNKYVYSVASSARVIINPVTTNEGANIVYYEKDKVDLNKNNVGNTKGVVTSDNMHETLYCGALGYFNAKNDSKIAAPTRDDKYNTKAIPQEGQKLSDIKKGDTIVMRVRIWLEGWDNECMNAIFNQTLTTSMQFKLIEPGK